MSGIEICTWDMAKFMVSKHLFGIAEEFVIICMCANGGILGICAHYI